MEALANSVFVPHFTDHHYPSLYSHPTCSSSSSSSSSCSWSSIRIRSQRIGSLKIAENSTSLRLVRCHAVSAEASGSSETGDNEDDGGDDKDDEKSVNNGFGLVSGDIVSLSHESKHFSNKKKENAKSRGRGTPKRSKKEKTTAQEQQKITIQQTNNKLGDLSQCAGNDKAFDASPNTTTPILPQYGSGAGGGTRAGLFRTPISGGVQSATSAHGLPRPALAVRNLMEQARFAHLCTIMSQMHHRRQGYPFGSLVDFAPDSTGHPIFSFSPLAIHTRNLLADPRCTLVVQIPGWSGLSNARVTIFGDVYPLPEHQQEWAHKQYIAKHQQGPSQQWGNFYYFRMQNISDIYFIGGFGTVAWVDVKEYEVIQPDKIAVDGGEQNLKELNAIFSKPLKELLSSETEVDDAALISIDSKGIDIRVRQGAQFNIQRISFDEGHSVETLAEAKDALWKLINKGRVYNLQK